MTFPSYFFHTLCEVEEIAEKLKMDLLVTEMTLLTMQSSEINLKQQIKELTNINRVEVKATCFASDILRLFGRPVYHSLDPLPLFLKKGEVNFNYLCQRGGICKINKRGWTH